MALSAGTRLGPYEILAPIDAGGMGAVYRARDARLDRRAAIKLAREKFTERFEREARAVAALNHPHICTLYDVAFSPRVRRLPFALLLLALAAVVAFSQESAGPATRIDTQGEWQGPLTVMVEDDFTRGASRTRFWMETDGERVEVHFASNPEGLTSGEIVKVRGIRIGNQIAATLTGISQRAAGASTCGPIGEQKIAILMIEFPGVPFPTSVVTAAELHEIYFSNTQLSLDAYWREASYGQTFATGDVFGPFTLNRNYDFFMQQFEGLQAAINAADSTVDFTVYNHVVVIWPLPGVSGWGGRRRLLDAELPEQRAVRGN